MQTPVRCCIFTYGRNSPFTYGLCHKEKVVKLSCTYAQIYMYFFICKTHFFCPSGCRLADLSVRLSYISIYFQCKTTSLGVSDWKHSKYSKKKKQKQPQIVTLNFVTPVTTKPHNAQRQSTVDIASVTRHQTTMLSFLGWCLWLNNQLCYVCV